MSAAEIDVQKVARLARLELTAQEAQQFGDQLKNVLSYVDILNEIDTTGIEPLAHPHETTNVLRPDVPTGSLPRESALSNAPKTDGKYFLVPQILDANDES